MKIWGVTEQEIRDAVAEVGLAVFGGWSRSGIEKDGRALRLRLSVNQLSPRNSNGFLPYQRKSMSTMNSRRIAAVCWHGHREFMRAIFKRNLEARIKTALADYRGAEDFEQKFEATFGQGNEYHLSYGQSCDCPEVATTGTMRHSDVLACPHVILDLKHYRPDGSCRCDDPSEQRRMMAEWGLLARRLRHRRNPRIWGQRMRGASDPAWRRYYADVARAHLRFREGHISSLELRRKIEAARRYANRTQKEES